VATRLTGAGIRALLAAACIGGAAAQQPPQNTVVVFETEKGAIEMEVDAVRAPISAANFLKYVDAKFYDGGTVNRAVRPDNTVRHDVEIQCPRSRRATVAPIVARAALPPPVVSSCRRLVA
jgi:Cyclophilin type peptidyl-prolyl cis-trans isomerase/CLD